MASLSSDSPISPVSLFSFRDEAGYDTPFTSPEASPRKQYRIRQEVQMQLDGSSDAPNSPPPPPEDLGIPSSPLSPRRLRSPDRFIASRADRSTFLLSNPSSKLRPKEPSDPFASPSQHHRAAHPTIRTPSGPIQATGQHASSVFNPPSRRSISDGAIWSVGGALVTEGIASTPIGRGSARVVSGTSGAPYHTADFLNRSASASEEQRKHGKRLALALEIDQGARVLDHSSPLSSPSTSAPGTPISESRPSSRMRPRHVWRDSKWDPTGAPASPTKAARKKVKDVPIIPFRVLDAPALRDDYYCSLLSYSTTLDCLAVGLGPHVYLWSEKKGTANIPDSLTAPYAAHVTSISFSSTEGGNVVLAIGRADGRITLWSPLDRDPRFDSEQPSPISCVCFRPNVVRRQSLREPGMMTGTEELLVGDEVGNVYLYSIEWPTQDQRDLFDWHGSMTLLARIGCHSQQVCGLAWSVDGEFWASGGNDNLCFLFESKKLLRRQQQQSSSLQQSPATRARGSSNATISVRTPSGTPNSTSVLLITLADQAHKHAFPLNAAVKALAFAPWQPTLLAASGGSNDRCIHFFHTLSGSALATIDCHAQVTSLVWSTKRKEIAATFGFAQPEHPFRVAMFGWPGCGLLVGIPWWGEERALFAVGYPRGAGGGMVDGRVGEGKGKGRRSREEGCLVVATSDASIKFHEVWPERRSSGSGRAGGEGVLGGSQILEGEVSGELLRRSVIR